MRQGPEKRKTMTMPEKRKTMTTPEKMRSTTTTMEQMSLLMSQTVDLRMTFPWKYPTPWPSTTRQRKLRGDSELRRRRLRRSRYIQGDSSGCSLAVLDI